MGLSSLFPPVLIFAFSLCFILKQNLFGPCYPFFCIFGVLSCLASFSFPLISFDLNSPPHWKVSSLLFILKQYLHDLCHPFFWIFFLSSCLLKPFPFLCLLFFLFPYLFFLLYLSPVHSWFPFWLSFSILICPPFLLSLLFVLFLEDQLWISFLEKFWGDQLLQHSLELN